ncbi:uncharacterized protein [Littorina saxatilis]|uniref:uncharacterized protein n=1 Tax=Littorina saxatilis TaxID=31220 RepID=UPI0038B5A69A
MTELGERSFFLCLIILAGGSFGGALVDILPDEYLPGVTKSVDLSCMPSQNENISQLVMLRMYRSRSGGPEKDPLATFLTNGSPVLEEKGVQLNASVSGFYNSSDPKSASLCVNLPRPTSAASGYYMCYVEYLDTHGLMHKPSVSAELSSLAFNDSVPVFYQALLRELRNDLDDLTSDLDHVTDLHHSLSDIDQQEKTKLSQISADSSKMISLVSDVKSHVNDVNQEVSTLETELARLRDITPDTPVNFYAYVSSAYITPANEANIVFNTVNQHTDSSYSASTGVFTAPINGTYRFLTGITAQATVYTSAAITVKGQEVTSLFSYDDYELNQATASAVVSLVVDDDVRVVKKTGSRIYGSNNGHHISYFMGMLLW